MKYIPKEDLPLLQVLKLMHPDSSNATLKSWCKEERIFVDGVAIKIPNTVIKKGQEVVVGLKKKFLPLGIKILYDDSSLCVVQKPAGLLSVSTDFEDKYTVHAALKDYFYPKTVHVVHRLDQDTSGLMIFAFTEKAYDYFKNLFYYHEVKRRYCAIVEGHPDSSEGTWLSYLYEDKYYVVHSTQDETLGKRAITHYKVLGTSKKLSWLDIELETGRKNQIRVQAQEAGLPIVGDKKYGALTHTKRVYLHAYALSFKHPDSGKELNFSIPVPDSFFKLVKPLGMDE